MIRPYERYHELYLKRGFGTDPVENAVSAVFAPRPSRPAGLEQPDLDPRTGLRPGPASCANFARRAAATPRGKRRGCSTSRKPSCGAVIPLHKELAASGQIELTTTPFYHPILPLLWDKRCARQAMPGCALPKYLDPYREDAQIHLRRAVALHKQLFGQTPVGMWPSEGSVSQDIVAADCRNAASNGSPPTRRSSPNRPTAGFPATARGICGIRRCSTGPGASKAATNRCT